MKQVKKLIENIYRAAKKYIIQNYKYYSQTVLFQQNLRNDIRTDISNAMMPPKGKSGQVKNSTSPYGSSTVSKSAAGSAGGAKDVKVSPEDQIQVNCGIFSVSNSSEALN